MRTEELALAEDRRAVLSRWIPGTEEHTYHLCLLLQHEGRLDEVRALADAWVGRHGSGPLLERILDRQAVLAFDAEPEKVCEYLARRLEVALDHQREVEGEALDLPTRLDPASISEARFRAEAARHAGVSGYRRGAFPGLLAEALDAKLPDGARERRAAQVRLREILSAFRRPGAPRLREGIERELAAEDSGGFGSLELHRLLPLEDLDWLAEARPSLLSDQRFVAARLRLLRPGPDEDPARDPEARRRHLDRLWGAVAPLPAVHAALKVHVLYHLLDHARRRGEYDRERLLTYLALPRQSSLARPAPAGARRELARLDANFADATTYPPVGDDRSLIEEHLAHHLRDEADPSAFEPHLEQRWLRRFFAETKILAGADDLDRWYAQIDDPTAVKALEERVEIELTAANPTHFAADDPVQLDVWVKNVPTLVVKVFEINAAGYFRAHGREVRADVDLDGLVASEEYTFRYDESPFRRVRRRFALPSIDHPGTYVVDLIGNGRASRALIRKGDLRLVGRVGAAGHVFRILGDDGASLPDATLTLEGKEYAAGDDGVVRLPFTSRAASRNALLRHGALAKVTTFEHRAERYELRASVHVDREQLLAGEEATAIVRASLYLADVPVSLSLLEEISFDVCTVDRDGVESRVTVDDFPLSDERETTHAFRVPEGLVSIDFEVRAECRKASDGKRVRLSDSRSYDLNGFYSTDRLEAVHLSAAAGGHVLRVLGRGGEARADRPVSLTVSHVDFAPTLSFELKSDARGRIELGDISDVGWLEVRLPDGATTRFELRQRSGRYPRQVHVAAGEEVALSHLGEEASVAEAELALFEGTIAAGFIRRLDGVVIEAGQIRLGVLPAGAYTLVVGEASVDVEIHVVDATPVEGWLATGTRLLEERGGASLAIADVTTEAERVRVVLTNPTEHTRVHLVATRFSPAHDASEELSLGPRPPARARETPAARSSYQSGRDIGDEYRYVLERRDAKRRPGNMLSRPSLLLRPWEVGTTETEVAHAEEGAAFGAAAAAAPAPASRSLRLAEERANEMGAETFSVGLDFLPVPSAQRLGLRPDEEGVVEIDASFLEGRMQLHVLAVDREGPAVHRVVPLPEPELSTRDRRLVGALDPDSHVAEQRRVMVVEAGEEIALDQPASSRAEVYQTVADVFRLYSTLCPDSSLGTFAFLARWHTLAAAKRGALYSEHACHELNFFLQRKDPTFFEAAVRPFIANKLERTFFDRYLLGEDLGSYLEPGRYFGLNAVERALLLGRLGDEDAGGLRHLEDRFALVRPDPEEEDRIFGAALGGRALDAGGLMGDQLDDLTLGHIGGAAAGGGGLENIMAGAAPPPSARPPGGPKAKAKSRARKRGERQRQDLAARVEVRALYRPAEPTQELAESRYYRVRMEDTRSRLVPVSEFWVDFARHRATVGEEAPFLSTHFASACRNVNEALLALGALDLPLAAEPPERTIEGARVTLRPASRALAFSSDVRAIDEPDADARAVLVGQAIFRADDRHRWEAGEQVEKVVTGPLLTHVAYAGQVVLTNPTSSRRKLELLLQIPEGSLPLASGLRTRTRRLTMEPYETRTVEYDFVFPRPGHFGHFPAHVTEGGALVGAGRPRTLEVLERPREVDATSWAWVCQEGEDADVFAFLESENLERLDLARVAFRMRERAFYDRALEILRRRHCYERALWGYALLHRDRRGVRELLRSEKRFLDGLGPYLRSELLTVDPRERAGHHAGYEHLEYAPLINARAHRLGREHRVLNDRLRAHWERLLEVLVHKPALDDTDRLAVAYYLLLMDRVDEGLEFLSRVDPSLIDARLQHDYLSAYAAFFGDDPEAARPIADAHAEHPVDRWRSLFVGVIAQLDEVASGESRVVDEEDHAQRQAALAATEASFEPKIEGGALVIRYRNLSSCRVDYYRMDIELLFSRHPFAERRADQIAFVRPNHGDVIDLEEPDGELTHPLPKSLAAANVVIEVQAGGQTRAVTHFANELEVQVVETYGEVRVARAPGRVPLSRVYVKCYARLRGGAVHFHKDGYTDLRGRFDYATLSTEGLDEVERFALLILSDEHGAVVREASPPPR